MSDTEGPAEPATEDGCPTCGFPYMEGAAVIAGWCSQCGAYTREGRARNAEEVALEAFHRCQYWIAWADRAREVGFDSDSITLRVMEEADEWVLLSPQVPGARRGSQLALTMTTCLTHRMHEAVGPDVVSGQISGVFEDAPAEPESDDEREYLADGQTLMRMVNCLVNESMTAAAEVLEARLAVSPDAAMTLRMIVANAYLFTIDFDQSVRTEVTEVEEPVGPAVAVPVGEAAPDSSYERLAITILSGVFLCSVCRSQLDRDVCAVLGVCHECDRFTGRAIYVDQDDALNATPSEPMLYLYLDAVDDFAQRVPLDPEGRQAIAREIHEWLCLPEEVIDQVKRTVHFMSAAFLTYAAEYHRMKVEEGILPFQLTNSTVVPVGIATSDTRQAATYEQVTRMSMDMLSGDFNSVVRFVSQTMRSENAFELLHGFGIFAVSIVAQIRREASTGDGEQVSERKASEVER